MTTLAGSWVPSTLDGDRVLDLDGVEFRVPNATKIKIVTAAGRRTIAHVKFGRLVYVLSALGMLDEFDVERRSRALSGNWGAIAGDLI